MHPVHPLDVLGALSKKTHGSLLLLAGGAIFVTVYMLSLHFCVFTRFPPCLASLSLRRKVSCAGS